MKDKPYKSLGLVVGVHFFIMFALTYVGVYRIDHIYLNLNRFYMAVLMLMPMIILMMLVMAHMFKNRRLNFALYGLSGLLFISTFFAIRTQAFVGNEQFLKSMIPHHSIAIKNCEEGNFDDPEIEELCVQIVEAQREEIRQMEGILERY